MDPKDILKWPDAFWCFRDELDPQFLRDDNYRVVFCSSDEWLAIITQRPRSTTEPVDK